MGILHLELRMFILFLVCTPFLSISVLATSKQFFVSPSGSDRNPGTKAQPFRTIDVARDAVRAFRKQNPRFIDTVTVILRGGRYFMQRPLLFGPEDSGTISSPTVYASFPGERPVVSGGIEVRGWKEGTLGRKRILNSCATALGEWRSAHSCPLSKQGIPAG